MYYRKTKKYGHLWFYAIFLKKLTMTGTIKFLHLTKDIYHEGLLRTVRFLGKANFWGNVLRYLESEIWFREREYYCLISVIFLFVLFSRDGNSRFSTSGFFRQSNHMGPDLHLQNIFKFPEIFEFKGWLTAVKYSGKLSLSAIYHRSQSKTAIVYVVASKNCTSILIYH
jgi:hypothetical protein